MMGAARLAGIDVSRETLEKLDHFAALLAKWTKRINLIAPSTVADIWRRHIEDSGQIAHFIPSNAKMHIDLGSGGGMPGIVLSILSRDFLPSLTTHLVESDHRKAAFLTTAIRDLGLPAKVHVARAETLDLPPSDMLTARAFAPLSRLLTISERFCDENTTLVLHKGSRIDSELTVARAD